MTEDYPLVQAAFKRVAELELIYGDAIPNKAIRVGFEFEGEKVLLENQAQGIFKPRQMRAGALSIKTTMPRDGGVNIYNDQLKDDGYYHYSLEAGDPKGVRNKLLWQSYESKQPFIYFHAVAPAVYKALWPCFIKTIYPENTHPYCEVLIGSDLKIDKDQEIVFPNEIQTRYQVRESKVRLHQASFRESVLNAYNRKCAVTGMQELALIEAAHIIPDSLIGEKQYVNNGIALSRIHHKAYDARLLGIDPNFRIHFSEHLLQNCENEFIKDAFLKFKGSKISVPRNSDLAPNRDFLARNFEKFELEL